MTAVVVGKEQLIAAHGLGIGDATRLAVSAAEDRGYSVAATGPGQFRVIRQTRPVWATVAAIVGFPFLGLGLLFLLVKKTDEGTIAVFEERDGTKVRLVGAIDEEIASAVAAGRSVPSSGKPPPTAATPTVSSQASASSSEPVIDSSPWASRDLVPGETDDDFGKTVARPRRKTVGAALGLRFPDGTVVPLATGVVIGRSPQAPNGKPEAVPVAYPDNEMSKTHLLVELADPGLKVTDLHSTNGTAVANNGSLVMCEPGQQVPIDEAATIHAGSSQITVTELA